MASFKILSASIFPLILLVFLTLSQFFHQHPHLAEADYKLIEILCHAADVPEICFQCLKSDPDAELATSKVELTVVMMNCISSHADALQENMKEFASNSKDETIKGVFIECSKAYVEAKKDVLSAIGHLKSHEFDEAESSLTQAIYQHYTCQSTIKRYKQIKISRKVAYEMKVYEELCSSADRIIERL
ncbi:Pectinesterase inhibitor domain containing protein [Trema orientale]|uniref:Pectinesterase inhibitor domain containing protein n=1 Tax=Trema orientale TaxID=63057 RepID=A0A2P5CCJ4_TREOI|nr:Pectinesterase inhibitor domain containing protein [Trema orientale]